MHRKMNVKGMQALYMKLSQIKFLLEALFYTCCFQKPS